MRGAIAVLATAMALAGCASPLDQADQAWTTALAARQTCYDDPSIAAAFPSAASQAATSKCDAAFASALQAINWPNAELAQEATTLQDDATSAAAIEATGQVPPTAQSQQYISDRQQLDDDLARERLSQSS